MDRNQHHNNFIKKANFKKKANRLTKVISCVTASLLALSPAVYSQDDEDTLQEEVIVFGIRQALTDALSMKRDAENIVDTVSAEDIGSLPDITIGESLARVSGVTVTSFRGRANEIAIRGLSPELTLVTINGREQTSTNAQIRNPLLIAYPSELISRAQVYKTPLADVPEGGVAGTINMETVRPLEKDERQIAGTFRHIRSKADELAGGDGESYRGSFAYVDQFADDTFGLALGLVGADVSSPAIEQTIGPARTRFPEASLASPDSLSNPADMTSGVIGSNNYTQEIGTGDEDRVAGLIYLQYQPNDQWNFNLDVTHTRLDATIDQTDLFMNNLIRNPNNDDVFVRDGSVISDNSGLIPNVDQGYPLFYISDDPILETRRRSELREDDVTYGGFNVGWDPTESWHFDFDYALTESIRERKVIHFRARARGPINPVVTFDRRNSIFPEIGISDVNLRDHTQFQPQFYREDYQDIRDKSEAFRLDSEYTFQSEMSQGFNITSVEFGYRFQERSKDRILDNEQLDNPSRNQINLEQAALAPYWEADAFSKAFGGRDLPNNWVHWDLADVVDQVAEIKDLPSAAEQGRGFVNSRLGVLPFNRQDSDAGATYFYSEDTNAFYIKANIEGEIGGIPYTGGFGVRWVETDVTANSAQGPLGITGESLVDHDGDANTPDILQANIDQVGAQGQEITSSYDHVLPALNITFELRDDLLLRTGIGTVIARPNFGAVRPITEIRGNNVTAVINDLNGDGAITQADLDAGGLAVSNGNPEIPLNIGNPLLEPFEANQIDISVEWYFDDDAALTSTFFYKDVQSFVGSTNTRETRSLVPGASASPLTVPVEYDFLEQDDEGGGDMLGIELGYQQLFSDFPGIWANLGFQGNYTYLESDLSVVSQNISLFDDQDSLANQQLATVPLNNYSRHLVNGQLYWEDDVYTIRLAYNFNSDEANTGRTNGTNERYADNASRWDLNLAYRYNDNWRFVFEVFNLLDDTRVIKNAAVGDSDVVDGVYDVETRPYEESYFGRTLYAGFNFKF